MFIKMASKRVSRCNFPIFLILLSGATIIYASDDSAPYSPSVDTVPYHRIYANEDISHTAGDGTQTVNLSHWYNDSIRGENARILHTAPDDTDLVVMRQLVGASSYIVKTTIVDSNAAVVFKVDTSLGRPPRHASAIYLCAMAFNVTNKYIDPAYPYSRADSIVAWVNVFFSNENSDTSLQIPLKFLKDIRNAMYINIVPGVAWTPVNTPTNPNSVQIDKMGSRYLDLLKIPFDSTFVNYKIDSVRIEVPRIYYTAYGAKYYGGIHVHGISFDTDYEIEPLLHFVQGDKRWKDTLINNLPGKRIGNRGCAITSCAMLLNKMGIVVPVTGDSVTPLNLLKWLEKNNGLDGADLIWGAISAFSQKSYEENPNQPSMLFTGHQITDVDSIENYLSSGIPVITRVKRRASTVGEHFVLSKGIGR